MKISDRVMIQMPGADYHGKIGRLGEAFDAGFLGELWAVEITGYPDPIGLPATAFRVLAEVVS